MRQLIRTDGSDKELPQMTMEGYQKEVGASFLATVALRHLGWPLQVMLVDDLGHEKQLPVNERATKLYWANCLVGTTHHIRGDVVVVPDSDFF
jgi:adenosine/AMP kinase